jgi:2-keto-4-pentenoate hydratase/2-oxohepta-3-ene-1,7-dioic acid hydratase in catechol pathway
VADVVPARPAVRVPVAGTQDLFPVRRIFCVGRNFAAHAREMGATVAATPADRGRPVFFTKPADAIVLDGVVPYPRGTQDLHHEVELVVALGRDAPPGVLPVAAAGSLVFGYGVGLDLTRRDLQGAAKAQGLPWDTGKAFDHSAPLSALVPRERFGEPGSRRLRLEVNGVLRQESGLDDLVWSVPEILHELSQLFALKAGDLVFMGTPAGVGPLQVEDTYVAAIDGVATLQGRIVAG